MAYVDGVRAIAILAVIGFHTRLPGFRGGFVGVDVFFVISGFLISHQIAIQLLAGHFSVMEFYARRALRILPPLLLVTLATLALAPAFPLLPLENTGLAKSAAATAAMISNFYFAASDDYFAPKAEINPLLHTWSLSVEEQYYLLAPAVMILIIVLARRRNWNATRALLIGGLIAFALSYVTLELIHPHDRRVTFFSIMTRAWQFAAGGTLAIAVLRGTPVPPRWRSVLGLAGFAAILASVHFYDSHMRYPGGAAGLLPTFGTVLLLASGLKNERTPLTRFLASRPAVAIGVLSYSWYLWHWPLIELMRALPIGQGSLGKDVASAGLALALSIPTYLLIERPMKRLRRPQFTRIFGGRIVGAGVGSSVLIVVLALLLLRSPFTRHNLEAVPTPISPAAMTNCRADAKLPTFSNLKPCIVGTNAPPSVMVMGDSHAAVLSPLIQTAAKAVGKAAIVLGPSVCPPLYGVESSFFTHSTCAKNNTDFLAWLKASGAPIIGAVLTARWSFYNKQDTPAHDSILPILSWADSRGRSSDFATIVGEGLTDFITTAIGPMLGIHRRILIIGPVPELKHALTTCLARIALTGESRELCAVRRSDVERRHRETWQVLRGVAAKFSYVRLIDPVEVLCDIDMCRPYRGDDMLYFDENHLAAPASSLLYARFEKDFRWVFGEGPAQGGGTRLTSP